MTRLPIVIEHHSKRIRPNVPNECLCVECGAVRPILSLPQSHVCTGLKPFLIMAFALHEGVECPPVIHETIIHD